MTHVHANSGVSFVGRFITLLISSTALLVDDDLSDWGKSWSEAEVGASASLSYFSSPLDGKYTAARVTNCPDNSACFQAELQNSSLLGTEGEYWFGFTSRLHNQWLYQSSTDDQLSIYFFRIMGSLQNSPQLALRIRGLSIYASICGNDDLDSSTSVCEEYDVGVPSPGVWNDWVVSTTFSHSSGSITIWRDNAVVLDTEMGMTSYRNSVGPTVALGLYVSTWDDDTKAEVFAGTGLIDWAEMHFRYIRIGGSDSSFDEVQTSNAFTIGTEYLGSISLEEALVRDMMPPSSSLCVGDGETSFTFDFKSTYDISKWDDINKDFEDDVFLAELKHVDENENKTWKARIAHGGNIYSYIHDVMGELMPPQQHENGPFNDEVWQIVMVDLDLHDANAIVDGMNRRYFIHQAGPYSRDSDLQERPFVSPSVAKHCENRECLFCGWGQQAHVPTRQTSDALYYTRFKDCGGGVMEQTWMVHNGNSPGKDTFTYTNVPWASVRTSELKDLFFSRKDGTGTYSLHVGTNVLIIFDIGMDLVDPLPAFGTGSLPNLEDLGGYATFAQDVPANSVAFDMPCGDGTGADVDCNDATATQVSITIDGDNTAVESPAHSAAWGRYTVVVSVVPTVAYHVPCQSGCEFRASNQRGEYVDLKGVMRWASNGNRWYMWPISDTPVEVNAKFKDGDTITVTRLDYGKPEEQNLALTWVFGLNEEYNNMINRNGDRSWITGKDRCRFGSAGTVYDRDVTVFTVNVMMDVMPGNTFYYRQYLIPGRLVEAEDDAAKWISESVKGMRWQGDMTGSTVKIFSADGTAFGATINEACMPVRCNGSTTPQPNTRPLYAITCGTLNYVGHDPYHFAPNYTNLTSPIQPYICNDQIPIRPTWKLLGYFVEGECSFVSDALYLPDLCSKDSERVPGLSYFFRPYVDSIRQKDMEGRESCSLIDLEQPHIKIPMRATSGKVMLRGSHGAYGSLDKPTLVADAPSYPLGPLSDLFGDANIFISGGIVDGTSSYQSWNQRLLTAASYESLMKSSTLEEEYTEMEIAIQLNSTSSYEVSPIPQIVEHIQYISSLLKYKIKSIKWCQ